MLDSYGYASNWEEEPNGVLFPVRDWTVEDVVDWISNLGLVSDKVV